VAWARSLAELRGRNADWAARAVRESASASASEAVREQAVDLLAQDMSDLLAQIDGREVTLPSGTVRLNTAGAVVETVEMWWGEQVLAVLSNPTLAFLLLVLGFYGILFELYTPGWGVAGTLGAICLVLAFLGLAILPINYVGLVLIAAAGPVRGGGVRHQLRRADARRHDLPGPGRHHAGRFARGLRGRFASRAHSGGRGNGADHFLPCRQHREGHRGRVQTGTEGLVGEAVVAEEDFAAANGRFRGLVQVHGELWTALSPVPVAARQRLKIDERQGLTLLVHPDKTAVPRRPRTRPSRPARPNAGEQPCPAFSRR
jgi:membrane-bound serine protease (ClpP class)